MRIDPREAQFRAQHACNAYKYSSAAASFISTFTMLCLIPLLSFLSLTVAAPATRQFPTSLTISPGSRPDLCLSVPEGAKDNSPIIASLCAAPQGPNKWDIIRGSSSLVRLSGTSFCFDAGVSPHNNVPMKLYTCYPGLTQQMWFYTGDDRIAITGGNQCLDLGPSGPQTYQCTTGNTNQVWKTNVGPPIPDPPTIKGVRIHPFGDPSKCLIVPQRGDFDGGLLTTGDCLTNEAFEFTQRWEIQRGDGLIRFAGSKFCLDAGSTPAAQVQVKLWSCYPGLKAQQWFYTADNHIAITGGTQCVDATGGKPLEQFCSGTTPGQVWTTSA